MTGGPKNVVLDVESFKISGENIALFKLLSKKLVIQMLIKLDLS
jgi:hypothetical protein